MTTDNENTTVNPSGYSPSLPSSEEKRSTLPPLTDGFVLYSSWWQEIEDLVENGETAIALELLLALGRYGFYGEEYTGNIGEVRRSVMSKLVSIDNQQARYQASAKGGRGGNRVSDQELTDAVMSGQYVSNAELGRAFGVSGQAIGQRLRKLGLSLKTKVSAVDLSDKNQRLSYLVERNNEK